MIAPSATIELAEGKKVYFISDLHLGASYMPETRQAERRVVEFLHSIRKDAGALYLMGDILDYWFEYRTVVPRGYVRFFGALAGLADAGVRIFWFIGNHDIWLFDYLRDEIGITIIDGVAVHEIMGKRFFLNHGDAVGRRKPGFLLVRSLFRNRLCQKLYSGIHPRWTIPFALSWSNQSRRSSSGPRPGKFKGMDVEPLALYAREYYEKEDPQVNYFVFGHKHVLADEPISPTCRFVILGDWISFDSYAVFDGKELGLLQF